MAKVNVGIGPGDLVSPFGERVSFPIGTEVERPIEDVYWVGRVGGVTLKYDSPEEEARAKELEDAENERIMGPLRNVNPNSNATISVPSEGLYDHPVIVVNPRGLLDQYDPSKANPTVQVKLDEEELRRLVFAVLQTAGIVQAPEKDKVSPPHTEPLAPPPIAERGVYDSAVDSPESQRDTAGETEVNPAEEIQREDKLRDEQEAKADAHEEAKPPSKKGKAEKREL